ncbi:MAG TPA: hypothetical protein VJ577_05350 [Burkholderiaceae bacterium]|nr:hypothetical protein [Burkholderiaceae bacterium]
MAFEFAACVKLRRIAAIFGYTIRKISEQHGLSVLVAKAQPDFNATKAFRQAQMNCDE